MGKEELIGPTTWYGTMADAPAPLTVEQCDSCKFYRLRTYGTAQVGECRYSDPFAQGTTGFWPRVKADDWCGKYVAGP